MSAAAANVSQGRGRFWLVLILLAAVVLSAIGVVYVKHQTRKLFLELQGLDRGRDAMDIEWGQLQLEQSTWSTHGRVEELARTKLGMVVTEPTRVVVVKP